MAEFSDIVVKRDTPAKGLVQLEFGFEGEADSPLYLYVTEKAFEKMLVREAR